MNDDGTIKTFEKRVNNKTQRFWEGAEEYEVDVPGQPNEFRILKKNNGDGTFTYGYTRNHYQTIYKFNPKQ